MSDDPIKDMSLDAGQWDMGLFESYGEMLCYWQRGINWWIGDLANQAERKFPQQWNQVFPEHVSPGLVNRCKAVSKAYPPADRNILATWSQHMQVANKPNRVALVAAMVDKGQTTDESRAEGGLRWLLAVDVNYYLHRWWHSGAGVAAGLGVAGWVDRTVERLREKGLTDVVCCFDSPDNARKDLTADWPDKYKDRPPKDPELINQLGIVLDLLKDLGFACACPHRLEADDAMASYAAQFDGRVTLFSQDKDLRQCLSGHCNMLLDLVWPNDGTGYESIPKFVWLSARRHTEETGISPNQWVEFQCLMGDACDGIKGAVGVGEKGAADLIKEFGTADGAIAAAKAGDDRIKPARRKALIEFEPKLAVTRQLVTLRTDLDVPKGTRLA